MLLKILQCTGQPPITDNNPFQNVNSVKADKPVQHLMTHSQNVWLLTINATLGSTS